MRLIGVLLMGFGATVTWYLGVKGEDLATLRSQIFAFFQIADPGTVTPVAASTFSGVDAHLPAIVAGGTSAAARAAQAVADAGRRLTGGAPAGGAVTPVPGRAR